MNEMVFIIKSGCSTRRSRSQSSKNDILLLPKRGALRKTSLSS